MAVMLEAVCYPDETLRDSHQDGATEPYIAEAVCALLKAKGGHPTVVELGGFQGTTSAWLALTLKQMGGGFLLISEPDEARFDAICTRLQNLGLENYTVDRTPSPQIIYGFTDKSVDFAFVDNDHSKLHVEAEINALWPKMKKGGLMLFHDVSSDGVCQLGPLIRKYGGIALDLPKLGPDGGLGIIQIPL